MALMKCILPWWEMYNSKRKNADSCESAFLANLVNYDTGDDAPCRAQIVGAFAPDVYRAIIVVVGDANAGQNPRLVYIETAAVGKKNFEHGVPPANELQSRQGLVIRKIESISKR